MRDLLWRVMTDHPGDIAFAQLPDPDRAAITAAWAHRGDIDPAGTFDQMTDDQRWETLTTLTLNGHGPTYAQEVERVMAKADTAGSAAFARLTAPAKRPDDGRSAITHCEDTFAWWLVMKDPLPLRAALATVAAHQLGGDPFALLVVGGSGTTKTVIVEAFADVPGVVPCSHLSGEAALLSGTPKEQREKDATGGLLRQVGDSGVLALKDFTTILAMNRDARGELLAAFREILDGSWVRSVGTGGGRVLRWRGRCTMLGASTTALDSAHGVLSMFGNRFALVRTGGEDSYAMARKSATNAGHEREMRGDLAQAVAAMFTWPLSSPAPPTDDELDRLAHMATLVSLARSPVERDFQGDISLIGDPDSPTRAAKVLMQLRGGMLALGYSNDAAWDVLVRVAFDSMPKLRRLVFRALLVANPQSTSQVAAKVGHPTRTVNRALEDLWAHSLVLREDKGRGHAHIWTLTPTARRDAGALGNVPLSPPSDIPGEVVGGTSPVLSPPPERDTEEPFDGLETAPAET